MVGIARRRFVQFAGAMGALAAMPNALAQNAAQLSISGPIPVTPKTNEPYRGENEQPVAGPGLPPPILIPFGYVEEEYFISGTVDGKPYSTSLLVRKPGDAAKFSGLVAVETIHAQGAIPLWGSGRDVWMPGGHAWVAVASQRIALEDHAKRENPARYSTLSIPDVSPPGPKSPFAGMGPGPQDEISQAIMTQVGTLLKDNRGDGPLRGLDVRYLVMGGASQTGGTTLRYIAQSHSGARRPDGGPIYDGYLPMEAFAPQPVPATDAAIVHACTEADVINSVMANRPLGARADSDAGNDRYRHYELTGASHVVTRGISDPHQVFSTLDNAMRPGEHLNQFPNAPFFTKFVANLVAWVIEGRPPPRAPRIELADGQIVRDQFGNAKGGLRTPYVDVPTVHYIASAPTTPTENPFRRLIGLQEPIPHEKLLAMYHSQRDYLRRFDKGIDALVAAQFLRAADGDTLKTEEAKNPAI